MRNSLFYFKWPLAVLLVGTLTRITDAFMKIVHWPGADILLTIATIIMSVAVLWLIGKLILLKQNI